MKTDCTWRLSLSATDLILLSVVLALLKSHISAAFAGSFLSVILIIQHALLIIVLFLHRPPTGKQPPWFEVCFAWGGTLLPLCMRPVIETTTPIGIIVAAAGSALSIIALAALGRSFGMEPAHRGIQTRWLYQIVRHPIYSAYLLIVSGYLLAHYSWWNAFVAGVWLLFQIQRIHHEEAFLSTDPEYRSYQQQVRWRLIPWIW